MFKLNALLSPVRAASTHTCRAAADKTEMRHTVTLRIATASGAAASFIGLHWAYTTLAKLTPSSMGFYNYSFYWLSRRLWQLFGIDPYRDMKVFAPAAVYAIHFGAPVVRICVFLALSGSWSRHRAGIAIAAASLFSLAYPALGFGLVPLYLATSSWLCVEGIAVIASYAVCVYVAAPRLFSNLLLPAELPSCRCTVIRYVR